ncbi:DNA cytosine methyltransferase [Lachnospiraceae bacterium 66-29]
MTLGSLFDGSGGFPLGGLLAGIKPLWASEIEPFPIRVTTKRLPSVKHLGDISAVDGAKVAPVDIITFGSPCTDMSVAGKRAGLDGRQSCLFYQAIRIVKEMRCATDGKYPRFIVWENVPGAFSSNRGEDFKAVLEAVCSVKGEGVSVPEPPKGKWANAGNIVGDGFSLAWRVLDAQFWGIPQRRKRIYLVADFAGGSAGKILFESEGVSGYSAEGFRAWQGAAGSAAEGAGTAGGVCLNDQGGQRMDVTDGVTCTLRAEAHHPPCVLESAGFCTEHSAKARGIGYEEETSPTLRAGTVPATVALYENHSQDTRYTGPLETAPTVNATYGMGGNNQPFVVEPDTPKTLKIRSGCEGGGKGPIIQDDRSATLSCNNDQTVFVPFCKGYRAHYKGDVPTWKDGKVANTLNTFDVGESRCNELVVQAYGICSKDSNAMKSDNPHSGFYEAETSRTLDANGGNPGCNQGGIAVVEPEGMSAFHINQRDEVIDLQGKSGALMATRNMQMQTFVLQGSMIGRDDRNGPQGSGINEDVSFTLDATDRHAVAQPTYCTSKNSHFTRAEKELANTLVATDYKDPPVINDVQTASGKEVFGTLSASMGSKQWLGNQEAFSGDYHIMEPEYIVRRLTPTECARLQGFPDWWCSGLGTEEPTEDDLAFWREVFETHRKIAGTSTKPKTDKQIIKWLKDPYSDSAEYKMWGNGVALPNVYFVLSGIVYYAQFPDFLL